MSDTKTINVATQFGDVQVKKLALGEYAKILRALKTLPKNLSDIFQKDKQEITNEYIFSVLPELIADALPEFSAILAAATDKDAKFIQELDLADVIDIFTAAYDLNDYSRVVTSVKKLMARVNQKPAQPSKM